MSIKIPISADLNGDSIKKQIDQINSAIKKMGDAVAKANGQKFEPFALQGKEDLNYFIKQSEKLLKIQTELKNRMDKSGQGGKNPFMADWSSLYLNESTRVRRMQEALVFMGGTFEDVPRPGKPQPSRPGRTPPPPPPKQNPWAAQGGRIAQAGLNAAGPVGGVAANALGTGMSAGFGAGLMGLLGGLGALGLGKLVGGAMENLDKAEQNNIAYDRLKRTLGDVNVSFGGLKTILESSGNNLAITFDEAAKLGTQFAKLANLSDDQYRQLGTELSTGVGFSRGFGIDPSQGMGFFGSMRGVRVTGSDMESRRLAVLIGETIGKSKAFAKTEEVMDAIDSYATQQTRLAMTGANISGYAGTFSALAGSGIPGLDPAGSAGMLGRINSALMNGGARGEASQFFSSMVANRMGLGPIQMAILREGGAFATNDQMFGSGSAAARFGIGGPKGNTTFLQDTLGTLRSKYQDPGLLAMATANHLGIGINPAMALLSIEPNQMGTLQNGLAASGVDMSTLNSSGISNLAKVFTGNAGDRASVAQSLLRRTGDQALSAAEVDRLQSAMGSGDEEQQKRILAELVSSRDQERTTGSDIRDSKNLLDNIKTAVADKLIPLVTEMRHGIMAIAGVGKDGETPASIQERVIRAEFDDKANQIRQRYQSKIDMQRKFYIEAQRDTMGTPGPDEEGLDRNEQRRAIVARQQHAKKLMADAGTQIKRLEAERDAELSKNDSEAQGAVDRAFGALGNSPIDHSIIAQIESGNRHYDDGKLILSPKGAMGRMQVMPGTMADPGFGIRPALNDSPEEIDRVGRQYIDAMYQRYGDMDKALAAYNAGPGTVDALVAEHGGNWFQYVPRETRDYVAKYRRLARSRGPAVLPTGGAGAGSGGASVNVTVPPIEVIHKNERGEQVQDSQVLQPVVSAPRPY